MELDRDRIRAIAWIAAALLVTVLAVKAVASGGSEPVPVAVDEAPAGGGAGQDARGGPAPSGLVVQVAGEVRAPGVYTVPPGARVYEAVERAGGLSSRADQAGVNLVAKVADGQQVVVPRRGAARAAGGGPAAGSVAGSAPAAGAGAAGAGPKVSLASATAEQLDAVDGIGPTLARRIIEYRTRHGGFRSVDELRQVDGIGAKRLEALREAVTP